MDSHMHTCPCVGGRGRGISRALRGGEGEGDIPCPEGGEEGDIPFPEGGEVLRISRSLRGGRRGISHAPEGGEEGDIPCPDEGEGRPVGSTHRGLVTRRGGGHGRGTLEWVGHVKQRFR